jgi:hypothetical protein
MRSGLAVAACLVGWSEPGNRPRAVRPRGAPEDAPARGDRHRARLGSPRPAAALAGRRLTTPVLLVGAELNTEMELQTAKDTTKGSQEPMGERGGHAADHVAESPATGGS